MVPKSVHKYGQGRPRHTNKQTYYALYYIDSCSAYCDKYFVFRDVEKLHFIQIFVIAVVDTKDMLNMDKFAEDFACLKEICLDQGQL